MVKIGDVVISGAGHDFGRTYVVISKTDDDFVCVCDGRYRKVSNPKRKRIKHLRVVASSEIVLSRISEGRLSDADIVYGLSKIVLTKAGEENR